MRILSPVAVLPVFGLTVMVFCFLLMGVMRFHPPLSDTGLGIDNVHLGVGGDNLWKPRFFKWHADGEISVGLCQGDHLFGPWFVGGWTCARLNHNGNFNGISAYFLDEVLLRQNAHEYPEGTGVSNLGYGKEENQESRNDHLFHSAVTLFLFLRRARSFFS